jgi:hypothetical protein
MAKLLPAAALAAQLEPYKVCNASHADCVHGQQHSQLATAVWSCEAVLSAALSVWWEYPCTALHDSQPTSNTFLLFDLFEGMILQAMLATLRLHYCSNAWW